MFILFMIYISMALMMMMMMMVSTLAILMLFLQNISNISLFPSMAMDLAIRNGTPFAQSIFDVYILLLDPCLNARN